MWRPVFMAKLAQRISIRAQPIVYIHNQTVTTKPVSLYSGEPISKREIGENVPRNEKVNFLVKILNDVDNSKESVYHALDAWVAWEQDFPVGPLRQALIGLEKEHQWHRIIHVIKWMLSKGQGTTMGTYGQLVRALDMDHRVEEAHEVWEKKLGVDLHSVPWQICHQMIGVYYRNNMMERVVKLFKALEAFDRKARDKKIVKKIGDAYEILGLVEEKERVLEKYKSLFNETPSAKKSTRTSIKKSKG
ncbi:pentatricopeptide repeat-containing protein At4g18975, chloroplastic-like [Bidens hawaiensis]|uniref:pentatricopeptide repeat-containing protein At4g18975, chloroplastic-like n=1 Tax=Bidens hawaiensis TaxID=980011 RepID=UPI00404B6A48